MIATLSAFAGQFKPALVAKAKQLFEDGKVELVDPKGLVWNASVVEAGAKKIDKKFSVSVRVVDNNVTDVFCTCQPGICAHITAAMFALQQKLNIEAEPYTLPPPVSEEEHAEPTVEVAPHPRIEPEKDTRHMPAAELSKKINGIFLPNRRPENVGRIVEEMAAGFSVVGKGVAMLRKGIEKDYSYYGKVPIQTGAKKVLGAGLLLYEEKNFKPVLNVVNAVLMEANCFSGRGYSANECGQAATLLLYAMYNSSITTAALKDEIADIVMDALRDHDYWKFHTDLLPVLSTTLQNQQHQEALLAFLNKNPKLESTSEEVIITRARLLNLLQRSGEATKLQYENLQIYGEKLIEEAFNKGEYSTAKQLALDAQKAGYRGQDRKWDEWLLRIAMAENDLPFIREYHRREYFVKDYPDEGYRVWKGTFPADEWKTEIQSWVSHFEQQKLSTAATIGLAKIYIEEGMPSEKIVTLFQKYPGYELARLTDHILWEECESDIAAFYRNYFLKMIGKNYGPVETEQLKTKLIACRTNAKAKRLVKEVVQHLFDLHPTWKAFRKQLQGMLYLNKA